MKNPNLGLDAAAKLKEIKKNIPRSIRYGKLHLHSVINVCRICGNAYPDKVDLRIDLGICPNCRSTKTLDGKERKISPVTRLNTDWWNDFVYYLIAHGTGEGWIDPDQRNAAKTSAAATAKHSKKG